MENSEIPTPGFGDQCSTAELHSCLFVEVSIGIEPIYRDFADLDLTSRTTDLVVVPKMRFELITSGV